MAKEDSSGKQGNDDPIAHDVGDDKGVDDPATHDVGDDNGVDDPTNHDVDDDNGVDDPATHDLDDDNGVDDPATHDADDADDDNGTDDPATHDVGDDNGTDDPATHDVGDDNGGAAALHVFVNERTGQFVFSDDSAESEDWADDHGMHELPIQASVPTGGAGTTAVWRFHDPVSDVYFWTADAALKDDLVKNLPELEFEGEAFRAFDDEASGGQTAIGLVWDHNFDGPYGRFIYVPADDAVQLAGTPDDGVDYMGVAFWI